VSRFLSFVRAGTRACRLAVGLFIGALFLAPLPAHGQYSEVKDLGDLRQALRFVGADYADGYLQPITDAFGANLNAGLFRTANVGAGGRLPGVPINVYLGVSVSGVPTGSLSDTFAPPASETLPSGIRIDFAGSDPPTAFGDTQTPSDASLTVTDQEGNQLDRFAAPPGLADLSIAPLIVPQLGIGTLAGTDLQVRYFPRSTLSAGGGSYGQVGLFGVALRHDLDQWSPTALPVDIAVQAAWTRFVLANEAPDDGVQDLVRASGWAFNLQASKAIPVVPVAVYGGLQYERFGVEYDYSYDPPGANLPEPVAVTVDQTAANRFRAVAGLSVDIALVRLNVDYALSQNNVVTAGLGVRL
jgi:hypothetical protein